MKYARYVWSSHQSNGETFHFGHLDAFTFSHTAPARDMGPGRPQRPALTFDVNVGFSHHCFTNSRKSTAFNADDIYRFPSDERSFCRIRLQQTLDYDLRGFVQQLPEKRCFRTDHHNSFSVVSTLANRKGYYVTYFMMERAGNITPPAINLLVESAYVKPTLPTVGKGAYQEGFLAAVVRVLGF